MKVKITYYAENKKDGIMCSKLVTEVIDTLHKDYRQVFGKCNRPVDVIREFTVLWNLSNPKSRMQVCIHEAELLDGTIPPSFTAWLSAGAFMRRAALGVQAYRLYLKQIQTGEAYSLAAEANLA